MRRIRLDLSRAWWVCGGALLALGLLLAVRTRTGATGSGIHSESAAPTHPTAASAAHAHDDSGGTIRLDPERIQLLGIETVPVGRQLLSQSLSFTGRIIPNEDNVTQVGPRVSGRVVEAKVRIGDVVQAGDIIATLDSVDLAQAKAAYHDALARLDWAQKNLARQKKFAAAGAFTAGPLEEARQAHAEAKVALSQTVTEEIQAQNELELAQKELERTKRLAEVGAFTAAVVEAPQRAVADARAEVAQAQADRDQASHELALAQKELARTQRLAELGAFTSRPVEEKRRDLSEEEAELATARGGQKEAENELQLAQAELQRVQRLAELGHFTASTVEEKRRAVADAEAELAEGQGRLQGAEAQARFAQGELERTQRLARVGALSREPLEAAQNEQAAAHSSWTQAQAGVSQAQRDLARLERLEKAGIAARKEVLAAQTEFVQREAALKQAQTRAQTAKAALERQQQVFAENITPQRALQEAERALAQAEKERQQAQATVHQRQQKVAAAKATLQREETIAQEQLSSSSQVQQAQTRVAQAEKSLQQAHHHVQQRAHKVAAAQATLQREETIAQEQLASNSQVQQAQTRVAQARKSVTRGEALVQQRQAKLSVAQATLDREETIAAEKLSVQAQLQQAQTRVAQATRSLAGKQQHVAEMQGQVKVAAEALAREQKLFAANLRAQQELQVSENQVAAAQIARNSAAETLRLLGMNPRSVSSSAASQGNGGGTIVPLRAPRGGLIIARDMNNGEMVSPQDTLATVLDLHPIYVEVNVFDKDLAQVQEGQLLQVRVRSFPGEAFFGRVTYLSGELDPQTQTYPIRGLLENPEGRLRPGMFAQVSLVLGEGEELLAIPQSALEMLEGQPTVFVQTHPDTFEPRVVRTGVQRDGWVEVQGGVREGEKVVQTGSFLLKSQILKGEGGSGTAAGGHGHPH